MIKIKHYFLCKPILGQDILLIVAVGQRPIGGSHESLRLACEKKEHLRWLK